MQKTVKTTKTVEVETQVRVCDLCEGALPVDVPHVRLRPATLHSGSIRRDLDDGHEMEICSAECLAKNAGAASLILNTKILPAVQAPTDLDRNTLLNDLAGFQKLQKYQSCKLPGTDTFQTWTTSTDGTDNTVLISSTGGLHVNQSPR